MGCVDQCTFRTIASHLSKRRSSGKGRSVKTDRRRAFCFLETRARRRSSTPRAMRSTSGLARAITSVETSHLSGAVEKRRDDARPRAVGRRQCGEIVGRCLGVRFRHPRAPSRVSVAAFDPSTAIDTVKAFAMNPSPGLTAATVANTSVFIGGFSVLRLGLTLAGVAHSWFLGTVRRKRRVFDE